jgi:Protein of unknown function (DUF3987)
VDEEARAIFFAFKAEIEPQMGPGTELEAMADWVNKLPGLVLRLAGVLHMADYASDIQQAIARSVGAGTMRRAIELGRYFLPHARAAFGLMAADPRVEDAKLVLAFVHRRGLRFVSRRDLHRGMQRRFRRAEHLDPVIDLLIRHGFLRELPAYPGLKGGPQERRFAVNPRSPEEQEPVTHVTQPPPKPGSVTTVTASGHPETDEDELERRAIPEADQPGNDPDMAGPGTGDMP